MLLKNTKVAIVGRPNVGKSTLFNILTNSRRAIIKDQPGVTRDIQYGECEWRDTVFQIMDTGGVTDSSDLIPKAIRQKVDEAMSEADLILFVVDGREGITSDDRLLYSMVCKSGKPIQVLVNKIDREDEIEVKISEFYSLSSQPFPCSFEKRQGVSEVLEYIYENFKTEKFEKINSNLTFCVLGKPNVGKSSLVNKLIGKNRMIVSPIAGTTVDAIDSTFEREGKVYTIIDTAGLRKKAKVIDDVEKIAGIKSIDSISRSQIILLMVDVQEGPTEQDAKMIRQVHEEHKAVILVANKIDEAENKKTPKIRENFKKKVSETFHFYEDIPVVYISAKNGFGIKALFEKIDEIWAKVNIKISTSELNRFFMNVIRKAPAPVYRTQNVKFYYLTQTQQTPPSFIAFANHPDGVDNAYRRFLMKNIKEEWNLHGIPVRIFAMKGS